MVTVETTGTFINWQRKLSDRRAQERVGIAIFGLGYIASVGGWVSEVRIHYGPVYRLCFTRRGNALIILLCGGLVVSEQRHRKSEEDGCRALNRRPE